ncbi:MAG: phosphotransferase [Verrucomicrobiales bacterium]|nr:phosphotransferase [Verrucomicrobiales bacterium]
MKLTPRARWQETCPNLFFLDAGEPSELEGYLLSLKILSPGQKVRSAARAGDGNMNCTLRVETTDSSLIVKQARPWVEKYPQFAAPWERAFSEAEFYRIVDAHPPLASLMPRLIAFDPVAHVIVLEDLGIASDYTGMYRGQQISSREIEVLAEFLSRLHRDERRNSNGSRLPNREMRALNHAHLFEIPLAVDNGLDLDAITDGLAAQSRILKGDQGYVREVARLGREVYLADGDSLLHGDFYPGSLLRTAGGPRVIDPEFGFYGPAEFDVGVFLAHLLLSSQPAHLRDLWRRAYLAPAPFDDRLMIQLAGVEIMRRIIGYAQLPVGYGLDRKSELLRISRQMVLEPQQSLLRLVEAQQSGNL